MKILNSGAAALSWGAAAAFFASAAEMLFMVGPFVGFYYAIFSPVLAATQATPWLCWLGDFWFYHIASPYPWVPGVRAGARVLAYGGLAVFLVHAAYLYWCKFVCQSVADRLLYVRVRHPQYLGLILAGLGLAICWPRFLNLVLWYAMLAAYHVLARAEEARMLASHGESYRDFMEPRPMFLPLGSLRPLGPGALAAGGALILVGAFAARGLCVRSPRDTSFLLLPGVLIMSNVHREADPSWWYGQTSFESAARSALADPRIARREDALELLYFVPNIWVLTHLLEDAGVPPEKLIRLPPAGFCVLRAQAFRPCGDGPCPPFKDDREALSPFALRKPVAAYYLPRQGGELKRLDWELRDSYGHASVPVL